MALKTDATNPTLVKIKRSTCIYIYIYKQVCLYDHVTSNRKLIIISKCKTHVCSKLKSLDHCSYYPL